MSDADQMSNQCKLDCIDKNFNFCVNSAANGGFCCYADEDCPRASICSNDNKAAPKLFKYMACPNEKACGTKNIYIDYDGEPVERAINKWSERFVKNDVCSYIIHTPPQMEFND